MGGHSEHATRVLHNMAVAQFLLLSIFAILLVQCYADGSIPGISVGEGSDKPQEPVEPKVPVKPRIVNKPKIPEVRTHDEPVKEAAHPDPPAQEAPKVLEVKQAQAATPHLKSFEQDPAAEEKAAADVEAKIDAKLGNIGQEKEVLKKMRDSVKERVENRMEEPGIGQHTKDRLEKMARQAGEVGDRRLGSKAGSQAEMAAKASEDARARTEKARAAVNDRVTSARGQREDITQRGKKFTEDLKAKTNGMRESLKDRFHKLSHPGKPKEEL